MTRHVVCLALLCLVVVGASARAQGTAEDSKDHYPIAWTKIDFKSIVDNDRLFKKYKECIISDKPQGCPRDITELKKLIPEIIESSCAKCLPEHVTRFKEGLEYICKQRKSDYEEVRKIIDPSGEIRAKFVAKYGKIDC